MKKIAHILPLAFAPLACIQGAAIDSVELDAALFLDAEVSTNILFRRDASNFKSLEMRLFFESSPSNNVEVAIGWDGNEDGKLGQGETELVIGWDAGEWFSGNSQNRQLESIAASTNSVAKTLSVICQSNGNAKAVDDTGAIIAAMEECNFKDCGMIRFSSRGQEADARLELKTAKWSSQIAIR